MSSLPQPLPPVPVQPIMYSSPVAQRPGLITAIGVISIVVGSLGLIFNGIAGLQAFGMVMISSMGRTAAVQQAAVSTAVQAQPSAPADPLSMPLADRQTVVRGLLMHRPLTKPRRDQLDALLVKSGRQIFKLRGPDLTVEVVRQNVTESGGQPNAKGGEFDDYFVLGEGTLLLADDHVKFTPSDGGEVVRVSASAEREQTNWQTGLTPAQVKAIIDQIESQAGAPLPVAQKAKLDAMLNNPTQGYFTPVATIPEATAQLTSVDYFSEDGVGELTIMTHQGMLTLDNAGATVSSSTWAAAGAGGAPFAGPMFDVNMPAAITSMGCAVLSVALAIYLLVIGILMLRQHPRAGRLLKLYAWIKLPVAIVGGIAWVVLWGSIMSTVTATTTGGAIRTFTPGIITGAIVAVGVGCLYPIALLITLRSRPVRDYYAMVT